MCVCGLTVVEVDYHKIYKLPCAKLTYFYKLVDYTVSTQDRMACASSLEHDRIDKLPVDEESPSHNDCNSEQDRLNRSPSERKFQLVSKVEDINHGDHVVWEDSPGAYHDAIVESVNLQEQKINILHCKKSKDLVAELIDPFCMYTGILHVVKHPNRRPSNEVICAAITHEASFECNLRTRKSFDYFRWCKTGQYCNYRSDYSTKKREVSSYADLKRGDHITYDNGSQNAIVVYVDQDGKVLVVTYSSHGARVQIEAKVLDLFADQSGEVHKVDYQSASDGNADNVINRAITPSKMRADSVNDEMFALMCATGLEMSMKEWCHPDRLRADEDKQAYVLDDLNRGDHIKWARGKGYAHHAIIVSKNTNEHTVTVVHFSSVPKEGQSKRFKSRGKIVKETLNPFKNKNERLYIVVHANSIPTNLVVKRAESRAQEETQQQYSVFCHNCEHFATWCKTGKSVSRQVSSFTDFLIQNILFRLPGLISKLVALFFKYVKAVVIVAGGTTKVICWYINYIVVPVMLAIVEILLLVRSYKKSEKSGEELKEYKVVLGLQFIFAFLGVVVVALILEGLLDYVCPAGLPALVVVFGPMLIGVLIAVIGVSVSKPLGTSVYRACKSKKSKSADIESEMTPLLHPGCSGRIESKVTPLLHQGCSGRIESKVTPLLHQGCSSRIESKVTPLLHPGCSGRIKNDATPLLRPGCSGRIESEVTPLLCSGCSSRTDQC